MKTLLISINAKYIHTNNAVRLLKANSDFDVDILEYTIKDDIEDIIKEITQYQPDVLGFSSYIWNINMIESIIVKLNLPNTKIILGGPEVSYDSLHYINKLDVDYILKGEGEVSFNALLHRLDKDQDISNIPNLTYKNAGKIMSNPIEEIHDLNTLNLPYYFQEDKQDIKHKISYIESSRGCPYKCSYCLSSLEKSVRFFDIEKVKEAILYLMHHGSKTIKFLDRTFNANKNTLDLLDFIIEHNNNETVIQFEITGDILDPNIIHHLNKKAPKGLFRFEIGIQSTNEETNRLVDRFQNTKKLFSNIDLIQKGDVIDLHLDLIAGLPNEDLESFKNTFNQVFKLGAKELQLGFLKMLRGTKIRNEALKYKYIFQEKAPYQIASNNVLSKDDIDIIHHVEHMLELYHNKGYFGKEFHKILLHIKDPFSFFYDIHLHYVKHGFKMKNYQIEDVYQNIFELLTEAETFLVKKDYLLRSKIKPKLFFETVKDKTRRREILESITNKYDISLHDLYKHSVIITHDKESFVVVYKHNQTSSFTIKEDS